MNKKEGPPDKPRVTSGQTDTESGAEGLDTPEERERALFALKSMAERGLISEEEYQARLKDFQNLP